MRTGSGDGAAVFLQGKGKAAPGRAGPGESRRAQANTDLQWKGLGASVGSRGCPGSSGSIPALEGPGHRGVSGHGGDGTVELVQGGSL